MTSIATDTTAPPPATHRSGSGVAETQMRGHSVRFNYLIYVYR
jgi:hypothetical protein